MSRRRRLTAALVVVVAVVVAAPSAPAGRAASQAKPGPCDDALTTADMVRCYSDAHRKVDRQLNAAYRRLRSHPDLSRARRAELVSAEQAWVDFKTADCEFAANFYKGGSFAPVAGLMCVLTHTKRRVADLRLDVKLLDR